MIRTRISLSEEEYEAAKSEARRLGISLAELLRRSLRTMLPADPTMTMDAFRRHDRVWRPAVQSED